MLPLLGSCVSGKVWDSTKPKCSRNNYMVKWWDREIMRQAYSWIDGQSYQTGLVTIA